MKAGVLLPWAGRGLLILAAVIALSAPAESGPIRLRQPVLPMRPAALTVGVPAGPSLAVIQLHDPKPANWRAQLAGCGVSVLRYVPDHAFVARLDPGRLTEVQALAFVRFVGEYGLQHKFDPRLEAARNRSALTRPADAELNVAVLLAPDSSDSDAAQLQTRLRGAVRQTRVSGGRILRGALPVRHLDALAASDRVLWIEPAPVMKLNDAVAARIVAGAGPGNLTLMPALGYDGAGVTVAVADSGLDSGDTNSMHPDLQGRVRALFYYGTENQLADAADEHSHGTHCAGIIAGNGAVGETDENGFLYGLGVAPGASVIGQRIFDAAGGYAPPASFETLTREAKRAGADIGSNSWGEDTQGRYDLSAMEFDALVRDADILTLGDQPYILEFSAGNAGPNSQTIGSPAVAKNVIATGASQNDRFNLPVEEYTIYADGQEAMADFSSRGPCADGRIKPDLVAPGSWIASLRSVYANDAFAWWPISDAYLYQGGTSQAGPQVAGAAAVFVQYWRTNHGGLTPSPALVKAALINSATDMNDGLTTDAVPNQDEGWGRVNLPALIGAERDYDFTDQTTSLTNQGVFEKRILVGRADEPLKITLAYTDVPGFPGAAIALVNDLDLEVVSPAGELFRGNRFADGESIPDAAPADYLNNVEAVHLAVPGPGEYVIRVRGARVMEDARIDTPAVDQDFALVISAGFGVPGVGVVTLDREFYRAPDQIRLTLVDYDLAGQPGANVRLRSATEPAGEVWPLFANGPTGLFTNAVPTSTGSPLADGKLQLAHADWIEAVYVDAAPASNRVAMAQADLQAPAITGVTTANEFGQLEIRWNTDEAARGEIYYGAAVPGLGATNFLYDTSHEIVPPGLAPNAVINYYVVAQDRAGNRTTNNNGGGDFRATNSVPPSVLLVDSYTENGFIPVPDIAGYTNALAALGESYTIFDATTSAPTLAQLKPFPCVIWRLDEIAGPAPALVQSMSNYVAGGGSLLLASMDAITRLGEAGAAGFVTNILQVQAHVEDQEVNDVVGVGGEPIGAGIALTLDYQENYEELMAYLSLFNVFDPSDWITPIPGTAAAVLDAGGQVVGVRSPKAGVDLPGRVVFLSFPLDTVPLGSGVGNNRAGLLQNILNFLVPRTNASALSLNSDVYSVPGRAIVEVDDLDQQGRGSVIATVRSPQHTNVLDLPLLETARPGLFRGDLLLARTNFLAPGIYPVNPDDTIEVAYFDASAARTNLAVATIDTNAPIISDVLIDTAYFEAVITWDTTKPADSLVQYSESPVNLPNNYVAYDPRLTTSHEVFLTGLKPETTYYVRVTSRDRAGNAATDDNGGDFHTFTLRTPLPTPWFDNHETNSPGWFVITSDESEAAWTRGVPGNGVPAFSGTNTWGSNLEGGGVTQFESYLISPGILLSGGNRATLRFRHQYDFFPLGEFEFQLAALQLITNVFTPPIVLHQFAEDASVDWEEFEFDLTPYLGQVVYVVWYHFLFSFDAPPRMGWLVDDVTLTTTNVVPGTIQITNNLWQSVFVLTGPSGRTASGRSLVLTDAVPGPYSIQYADVPYFSTPPAQSNSLASGQTITFTGNYRATDVNTNALPDGYEATMFGGLEAGRTATTDTDGDGLSDWAEFVAGTDPNNPPPPFRLVTQGLPGGLLRLTWRSVTNHSYRVQTRTNGGAWGALSGWFPATGTNTSYTVGTATNGPARFFRVEAAPPVNSLAATFRVTATRLPSQQVRLDWPAAPGHGYRVLGSTNARDWSAVGGWQRVTGYAGSYTMGAPTNSAPFLFRVEAEP